MAFIPLIIGAGASLLTRLGSAPSAAALTASQIQLDNSQNLVEAQSLAVESERIAKQSKFNTLMLSEVDKENQATALENFQVAVAGADKQVVDRLVQQIG